MTILIANIGGILAIIVSLCFFYGLLKTFIKETLQAAIKALKEDLKEAHEKRFDSFKESLEAVGGQAKSNSTRLDKLEAVVFPQASQTSKAPQASKDPKEERKSAQ